MLIDWFTTAAQIINFLILVFLLKHFLYGPIIRAMDRREQKITDRLSEAQASKKEAERQKSEFEDQLRELQQQKDSILTEAREKAETERKEMQQDFRRQMEETRHRWQQELARQQQRFLDDLRKRVIDQVLEIASRALGELADQELQGKMVAVFIRHLKEIDEKTVDRLRQSLAEKDPQMTVTSVFDLDPTSRQQLTSAVHDIFGSSIQVRYRQDEQLLAGMKLSSSNEVIGWNLEEYVAGLREEISRFIDAQGHEKGVVQQNREQTKSEE